MLPSQQQQHPNPNHQQAPAVYPVPLEYSFWLSVYLFHVLPGMASEWKHHEGRDPVCFVPHYISFAWRVPASFGPSVTIPWLNGHWNSITLIVTVSLKWVNMCNAFTIEAGSGKSWTRVESEKWKWKLLSHLRLFATPWTVYGILQARVLECVAFPFSRGSSQPRDQNQISIMIHNKHFG